MPLAKCPRTGKLFDNTKGVVHPSVEVQEEEDYTKVLDFLASHPNATTNEIMEATGVTQECIQRMIKRGRVKEMDETALAAQANEFADRAAEVARRKEKLAGEIGSALRDGMAGGMGGSSSTTDPENKSVRSTLESKRNRL